MQCKLHPDQFLKDILLMKIQRPPKPLSYYKERYQNRQEAMAKAYLSGHYTLTEVGTLFGVSYATVSRAVKLYES